MKAIDKIAPGHAPEAKVELVLSAAASIARVHRVDLGRVAVPPSLRRTLSIVHDSPLNWATAQEQQLITMSAVRLVGALRSKATMRIARRAFDGIPVGRAAEIARVDRSTMRAARSLTFDQLPYATHRYEMPVTRARLSNAEVDSMDAGRMPRQER